VLFSDRSLTESLQTASNALAVVFNWFVSNKLNLNIDKTHFILFSTMDRCDDVLFVNNTIVNRVQSTKFLGLFIDENLSWSNHIKFLHGKLSKSLGLLLFASHCIPRDVLLTMYFALFHSVITYILLIWGNTFTTY
jgi:hypothetical protein